MFERVDYRVERIDGDYAYLKRTDVLDDDEKCVARAFCLVISMRAAGWRMRCWSIRFCDMPKRPRRYE